MKLFEFFDDSSKWTKRAFAKNKTGSSVNSDSPAATCWCLIGAIMKLTDGDIKKFNTLYKEVKNKMKINELSSFNDNCSDFKTFQATLKKVNV